MFDRLALRTAISVSMAVNCLGAPVDWPHLKLTRVASGLNEPVSITSARDGTARLFIAERFGKIKVLLNGELQPEPFLDISSKLETEHYTHGIMALAFPPAFAARQHFYVHYTPNRNITVLSRFHVPPGSATAEVASEEVILTTVLNFTGGPSAGHMEFGPDGYLYLGRDASEYYQPQHFDNVLGKILRIDVESPTNGYAIPSDNPFAAHATHLREIWSWGLVHPHSLSFDHLTGDLYLTDQQGMKCEVNLQPAARGGVDHGAPNPEYIYNDPWATYERYAAVPPVFIVTSYETFGLTGRICRDTPPSRMSGIYFMGHLNAGYLAGLAREGTNWIRQNFAEAVTVGHNFGEDESGRLYAMSRYEGTIDRIEDSGKVRPPELLAGGVTHTDTPILSSSSPGARIRYTTDGRDPAPGDPEIPSGQSVNISTGMTLKAQALRDDLLPSDISTATYTAFKVAYPIFIPAPGDVPNPTSITITSATPGAIIRYTTNGALPTLTSPIYRSPVVGTGNQVLYAQAFRAGFQDSDLNAATYTWATAVVPRLVPEAGPITNGTRITMLSKTPGAVIRYTTNGANPTATSPKYTNSVRINGNTTVKARIFAKGYQPSAVTTVFYDLLKVTPPTFNPAPGVVPYGTAVQLISPTPGATIRYTTNGADPTSSSPVYSNPIVIFADTMIKARGFKSQLAPSLISAAGFQLPQAKPPTFSPGGPIGREGASVILSSQTRNAQIFYTLDGTNPNPTSKLYRRSVYIKAPSTVCAKAYAFGFNPSDTATNFFGLADHQPTIVQTRAGNGQAGNVDGAGPHARFNQPQALCVDENGTVYVADTGNHTIRAITREGTVITVAGSGIPGFADGIGTNAVFNHPVGIAVDPVLGNLYVAESGGDRIRKISPAGVVTTIRLGDPRAATLWQLERSSEGLLYCGSWVTLVSFTESGAGARVAGPGSCCVGGWDVRVGVGLNRFDIPHVVTSVRLVRIDPSGERQIAGSAWGYSDGPALQGRFTTPLDVAFGDDDVIYIADANRIRMMSTNAYLSTLAGSGRPGYRNGASTVAEFNAVSGVCVDRNGVAYVADTGNHAIRKISFDRDHDTIPDVEDPAVGIDDRLVDSDGDGQSNAQEFWASTNPGDSNSILKIQASHDASNRVIVSWPSAPARSYVLMRSTNLSDWDSLLSVPGDGTIQAISNSPAVPRSFYRLRLEP